MTQKVEDVGTKTRLLDAAERLFGEQGFEGVSMRTLADEAQVNLGAATYHFGSKEKLYLAAFFRRFRPTAERRMHLLESLLAEARTKDTPPKLETVLECLFRPPLETIAKHPAFFQMMSRNLFMPPAFMQDAMRTETDQTFARFIKVIEGICPDSPRAQIQTHLRYCLGMLLVSVGVPLLDAGRKSKTSKNKELEQRLGSLVRFASAGFQSYEKDHGR